MTDWMLWFVVGGTLVVLEMFSGTFYLLMVAIGFFAGGLVALTGASASVQLAVAAVVGVIATYGLRRNKWGKAGESDVARNPDVNLDIGQALIVDTWGGEQGGVRTARVMYRGAQWDVELEAGAPAVPGTYIIHEVRGNRLIVGRGGSNN